MSCQEDPRTFVDTDGLRHSFDTSMQALDSSDPHTEVAVSFITPESHENTISQQEGRGETLPPPITIRSEKTGYEGGPGGLSGTTSPSADEEKLPFPFFKFPYPNSTIQYSRDFITCSSSVSCNNRLTVPS